MGSHFTAKSLPADRVMQAYPLLQASEPNLTLERWQHFAAGRSEQSGPSDGPDRGIIAVESESGYLHGLFTFDIAEDLALGRTLFIDNIVVADLIRRRPVVEAMIDQIDTLAAAHNCQAQRIHLPDDSPSDGPEVSSASIDDRPKLVDLFVSRGHEVTKLGLCKQRS